jgi:hypothetical protein
VQGVLIDGAVADDGRRVTLDEVVTTSRPIVASTIEAPVSDMSSWVTACWMTSPTTINRTRSNGPISASSRLPVARITAHSTT